MRKEMETPVGSARKVLVEGMAERGTILAEPQVPPRVVASAIAAYLAARKRELEKLYGGGIGLVVDDEIRGLGGS